jgi:hypothetical protein
LVIGNLPCLSWTIRLIRKHAGRRDVSRHRHAAAAVPWRDVALVAHRITEMRSVRREKNSAAGMDERKLSY